MKPCTEDHFQNSSDDSILMLIAAHQADLLAYIHSMLPGDPSVDDILQRTNLVLWRKRRSFEKGTSFHVWACAVARWEGSGSLKQC
jgi:RNA polymerase sigma-70 factor (ECF subfamily)